MGEKGYAMDMTLYIWISLAVMGLALVALGFLYLRLATHYNRLTRGVTEATLMQVLEGIQKTLAEHEKALAGHKSDLQKIREAMRLHIQHVTLKRFNPFSDTGGDQSFILSLLDGNQDGIVITSLHSRENTRFYVKSVQGGVGIEHPLSSEEQKVVNKRGK